MFAFRRVGAWERGYEYRACTRYSLGSQSFWNYWLEVTKAVSLIPITPTGYSLMIPDRAAYKVR